MIFMEMEELLKKTVADMFFSAWAAKTFSEKYSDLDILKEPHFVPLMISAHIAEGNMMLLKMIDLQTHLHSGVESLEEEIKKLKKAFEGFVIAEVCK